MALEMENINLDPHKVTGRVELSYTPSDVNEVAVDPLGGPAQVFGEDYIVEGNELIWVDPSIPDSDIKDVLDRGFSVTIRVIYQR